MANGSIPIIGDLKFLGYKQKARPGLNRQVLTYRDGDVTFENIAAENLVTSPASQDVIVDNDGNVVVSELDTYSGIDTKPRAISELEASTDIQGRLEVNVINGSGATLNQYSAYSLEDNAYTLEDNTVTLTPTRTGIPTQGQTALFFCQESIPSGSTGVGVIKGLITTTVLQSVDSERDLKVLASGSLSDIVLSGEYVVGTVTRSPLLDTPLEIAFDGLSNYKFVVDNSSQITEFENNGIRVGTDATFKLNFKGGTSAILDPLDPTTVEVEGRVYTIEDERIPIVGQADVTKINFTGLGVTASRDSTDTATIDIDIPGIAAGTGDRIRKQVELVATNSAAITLPRLSSVPATVFEKQLDEFPSGTSSYSADIIGESGDLIYFATTVFVSPFSTSTIHSLDITDNTVTTLFTFPTGFRLGGSTVGVGNGFLFYKRRGTNTEAGNGFYYKLNLTTLVETPLSFNIAGTTVTALGGFGPLFVEGDFFYTWVGDSSVTTGIYRYQISNNTWTFIVDTTTVSSVNIRSIVKIGNILYLNWGVSGAGGLYSIDLDNSNAIAKVISAIDGNSNYLAAGLTTDGTLLYFESTDIFSYDPNTDILNTLVSSPISGFDSFVFASGSLVKNGIGYFGTNATPTGGSASNGIYKATFQNAAYYNDIIFDTVSTNTDAAKFNYDTTTGILTVTDEIDHDIAVALTITNSAAIIDTDYRIGIRVNNNVIPPSFINTTANGSTTYEITIPFHNNPSNTYKLVEFIPDPTAFANLTSVISSGATLTLHSVEVIGISDGVSSFTTGNFSSSNVLIVTHSLGSENVIAKFKNRDVTPNKVLNLEYDILDSNRIQITQTPFNGEAIILGI